MYPRILITAACLALLPVGAHAQDTYKIGSSLGLTGYAATNDRAWRDGMQLAVDALNAKGGILGKKIELIVEDNKSEPQEAVVVYKKMMANDKVQIFDSGCVSAGNFAAASSVIREQIPMMLCSILPPRPEELKWGFSVLPPPRFEVEVRYQYLKDKGIKKIGILHDPTPYALLMKDLSVKLAADYGIEIVATDSYKPDDSDMSVQLGRMNASGAAAIFKIGQGGSTVTIAKNIKQLGFDKMIFISSLDDGAPNKAAGEVLGDRFLFVVPGVQVFESVPAGPARDKMSAFLKIWNDKYPDRDPNSGSRAWDSINLIAAAAEIAKSVDGPKMRDAFEKIPSFQGAFTDYNFSADQHVGVTKNPFFVGTVKDGKMVIAK